MWVCGVAEVQHAVKVAGAGSNPSGARLFLPKSFLIVNPSGRINNGSDLEGCTAPETAFDSGPFCLLARPRSVTPATPDTSAASIPPFSKTTKNKPFALKNLETRWVCSVKRNSVVERTQVAAPSSARMLGHHCMNMLSGGGSSGAA